MSKKYWSQRKGINSKFDLNGLKRAFKSILKKFLQQDYYQEFFGFYCVDQGDVSGKAGNDISEYIFRKTRREIEWPLIDNLDMLDEDFLFDIIEFMHDCISKPVEGYYHSYSDCGYHYNSFNAISGQGEYRQEINALLNDYSDGYELNNFGEIILLLTPGLKELTEAFIPTKEDESRSIKVKMERAIKKYRDRHSNFEDRKEALRALADVLEYLRPTVKTELLTKDENELFNIANNFAVRHNNAKQKDNYGPAWLSWIFYLYLATIHLCLRLRDK